MWENAGVTLSNNVTQGYITGRMTSMHYIGFNVKEGKTCPKMLVKKAGNP